LSTKKERYISLPSSYHIYHIKGIQIEYYSIIPKLTKQNIKGIKIESYPISNAKD
jgi:hypothetical protein